MEHFRTLIDSYVSSGHSSDVVAAWCDQHPLSGSEWDELAQYIGQHFLAGDLAYDSASGLINRLMPAAGWEAAPRTFWEYYVAFENTETHESPAAEARGAVQAVGVLKPQRQRNRMNSPPLRGAA